MTTEAQNTAVLGHRVHSVEEGLKEHREADRIQFEKIDSKFDGISRKLDKLGEKVNTTSAILGILQMIVMYFLTRGGH